MKNNLNTESGTICESHSSGSSSPAYMREEDKKIHRIQFLTSRVHVYSKINQEKLKKSKPKYRKLRVRSLQCHI